MRDLSLHVLDLAQNSVKAHASLIEITLLLDPRKDTLTITIADDGDGMPEALLAQVTSPFTTTRTTRKVGLGIPLMMENAERTDGGLRIQSKLGEGTRLCAWFGLSHIDRPPMGDMAGSILSLVLMSPDKPDYHLIAEKEDLKYEFDTREIRAVLGDLPLSTPDVTEWIRASLQEGLAPFQC